MGAIAAPSGILGNGRKRGCGLGLGFLYSSLTQLSLPHLLRISTLRCPGVLVHVATRFAVSSSLSSVGNLIASAGASNTAHSAVSSAIAHVAVTAVAIASGACLSTKVDFLWPRGEDSPDCLVCEGVDVTGYSIFCDTKVQKAINFARKAHHGQQRKTGDPYVTHCIHTGKILAAMIPSSGHRAVNTIVAGILHDVIDDTFETLRTIQEEFGDDVAHLVAGVSKLSYINQAKDLRGMLLGMVDDPRVVLIKLADRLHNMRTIYALPRPKAQAVAEETLSVWCSLASRLGVWALKAELEDLCFAVLQPGTFREMRSELASMWSFTENTGILGQISEQWNSDSRTISGHADSLGTADETDDFKDLLQAVLPFDLLLDRRKRSLFLNNLKKAKKSDATLEVVTDAGIALSSLVVCEEALEREIFISTSYIPGMEVTLSSRLKSLYSIYCKMKRKDISIKNVYDARALRVVVGDKNGMLHGPAVKNCYSLLSMVHRLWSPIDGEFDDYIINPKPSGYQSLHTAVQGPDNYPLEIQIRTHVSDQWWFAPGHGDWSTCLEKYTLCRDGMYHKQDQFQRLLPTFIQIIELTEAEEEEYQVAVAAVFEGKQLVAKPALSRYNVRQKMPQLISCPMDCDVNNKVLLLRTMLQWEEEVRRGASPSEMKYGLNTRNAILSEVVIICWPHGEIMRISSGSTAADAARRIGMEGKLVLVNGQLAPPHTELKDGDILEVRL